MSRIECLIIILAIAAGLTVSLLIVTAVAHGNHEPSNITINNYYEIPDSQDPGSAPTPTVNELQEVTNLTITNGVSSDDLAAGVAAAMAGGGHQFDFSTQDWQGSVVGTWQLSGENENAASFGIAKRWAEGLVPNALFHVVYTPQSSDDWLMVGGTFRF